MLDKGKSPQKGCVPGAWIDAALDDVHAGLVQLASLGQITLPEGLDWTQGAAGKTLANGEISGYTFYLRIQDARSSHGFSVRQFRKVGRQGGKVGLEQHRGGQG